MSTRSATMSRAPARAGSVGSGAGLARRAGAAALRSLARHPGTILGMLALVGGVGIFGWNVLMTQSGRHPAPLFASAKPAVSAPAEPARRPEIASTPPIPVPRPETVSLQGRASTEPVARAPSGQDPIGALIKSSDPHAPRPGPDAKPASSPRLVSVQRALAKLGYGPIGIDGVMGSTTRQALERFERDRSLPVTGALGARTIKQLVAASGIQIE